MQHCIRKFIFGNLENYIQPWNNNFKRNSTYEKKLVSCCYWHKCWSIFTHTYSQFWWNKQQQSPQQYPKHINWIRQVTFAARRSSKYHEPNFSWQSKKIPPLGFNSMIANPIEDKNKPKVTMIPLIPCPTSSYDVIYTAPSGWNKEKLAGRYFLLFWENDCTAIAINSWGFGGFSLYFPMKMC